MKVLIHVSMFLAIIIVFFYGVIQAIKLNIVLSRIKKILLKNGVVEGYIDFVKWNQEKLHNKNRSNIDFDFDVVGDDRKELESKIGEYYLLMKKKNKVLIAFFILLLIEMVLMIMIKS